VVSFIGGGIGVPAENTDLSQVTDKIYHIMLYQADLAISGVRTHNFNLGKKRNVYNIALVEKIVYVLDNVSSEVEDLESNQIAVQLINYNFLFNQVIIGKKKRKKIHRAKKIKFK
jgi:hypothetical protein